MAHSALRPFALLVIACAIPALAVGCGVPPSGCDPRGCPPSPSTVRPADEAAREFVLNEIRQYERRLGRALTPARIVSVRHLAAGTLQPVLHRDGTTHGFIGPGPNEAGWVVEAEGTFLETNDGAIEGQATRAYYVMDEGGGEAGGYVYAPVFCWTREPLPDVVLDGSCP